MAYRIANTCNSRTENNNTHYPNPAYAGARLGHSIFGAYLITPLLVILHLVIVDSVNRLHVVQSARQVASMDQEDQ